MAGRIDSVSNHFRVEFHVLAALLGIQNISFYIVLCNITPFYCPPTVLCFDKIVVGCMIM